MIDNSKERECCEQALGVWDEELDPCKSLIFVFPWFWVLIHYSGETLLITRNIDNIKMFQLLLFIFVLGWEPSFKLWVHFARDAAAPGPPNPFPAHFSRRRRIPGACRNSVHIPTADIFLWGLNFTRFPASLAEIPALLLSWFRTDPGISVWRSCWEFV